MKRMMALVLVLLMALAFVMVIEEYMDAVTQYPVTVKLTNLTDAI